MDQAVIKAIVYLLVGISVLLIGMKMMSGSLKKSLGHRAKKFFQKTENRPFLNMGFGALVTAGIQSSDATNAMVIGFISAGAMGIYQGLCIMLGAYIGTTITGVLASFSSLSISLYFLLLAFIGTVMMFFTNDRVKNIGEIAAGLGLLFFGLAIMKDSFKNESITSFCQTLFSSIDFGPLLFLIGVILTAIIQSSSATTSIVIAMVGSGALALQDGLFIVLGATLGTVCTTILAAIGGDTRGKKAAWAAFVLRSLSSVIVCILLDIFKKPISVGMHFFAIEGSDELPIALFTVFYNVIFMPLLLPLVKPTIRLMDKLIKEKENPALASTVKFIDDKMLSFPDIAVSQVKKEIVNMYSLAQENYNRALHVLLTNDDKEIAAINETEDRIDYLNNRITSFLIALSSKVGSYGEHKIGSYYHVINDIERIGDHAINLLELHKQLEENDLHFSGAALEEIESFNKVVSEMFSLAETIFTKKDKNLLEQLHSLEDKADNCKTTYFSNHYHRIINKECANELSPFYSSFLTDMERISDHLDNIGFSIVDPTGLDEESAEKKAYIK